MDEKGKGKGLVSWSMEFTHEQNWDILDDKTTFAFDEEDLRDKQRSAEVSKTRADVSKTRVDALITTPEQELQVLVDLEELPKEFIEEDQTPGEKLTEDEKPEGENGAQSPEEEPVDEEKSLQDLDLMIEEELESAEKLYESIIS